MRITADEAARITREYLSGVRAWKNIPICCHVMATLASMLDAQGIDGETAIRQAFLAAKKELDQ